MNTKIVLALLVVSALRSGPGAFSCELSAEKVGQAIGTKTTTTPDGVVRVGWPRTDVKAKVDGVPMRPFAGLGSWAAFQKTEHGAMLMGDTVVFQDEVSAAIDAAIANGIEITGLHNHFFFDEPKVYFMHIGGEGCPTNWLKVSEQFGMRLRKFDQPTRNRRTASTTRFRSRGRSMPRSWLRSSAAKRRLRMGS